MQINYKNFFLSLVIFLVFPVIYSVVLAAIPTCTSWDSIKINGCTQAGWFNTATNPRDPACKITDHNVTLHLNSPRATMMFFKNINSDDSCSSVLNTNFTGSRAYSTSTSWTLSPGAGAKRVCVLFSNNDGFAKCGALIQVAASENATPVPTATSTPVDPTVDPGEPTEDPNEPTLTPEEEGSESESTPGEDFEAETDVAPEALPVVNPNCLCTNNFCTTQCNSSFLKFTNITYANPIKCLPLATAKYRSVPTAAQADRWCKRPMKTKGDANGNGVTDLVDYFYTLTVINTGGKIPATVNPDFNGDGLVNATDKQIVIRKINNN